MLFVGYQAPGTLGELILRGEDLVRIHGHDIRVRATIRSIGNYSAHADQPELLAWIKARLPVRAGVFLTHGEDDARSVLRDLLIENDVDGDIIHMPQLDDSFMLEAGKTPLRQPSEPRLSKGAMVRDWANDYTRFTLALAKRLEAMPQTAEREALMAKLEAALNGEAA